MLELPLTALKVGAQNVRHDTAMDDNLKTLMASIASVGLLQPLVVTGDSDHGFEIVAGRRRFTALSALTEGGHVFDTVPCVVVDAETAVEASLAENYARENMKPAQLYRAFVKVRDSHPDYDDKALAKMFDLDLDRVRRTLRLGNLHPDVFAAYESGGLNDDQAAAYAATEDRELQASIFESMGGASGRASANQIRAALGVQAGTLKLAVVGLDAYREAGGRFEQDLFNTHANAGRILDPEILDTLANTALCNAIAKLTGGDDSVKLCFEAPKDQYGSRLYALEVKPEPVFSDEQKAKVAALMQRIEEIDSTVEDDDEEIPDENYQALLDERESAAAEVYELEENPDRLTYPAGRKIAVPTWGKRQWDSKTSELYFTVYWADKQAQKDAEAAAKALAKAEGGVAAPTTDAAPAPKGDNLTGRATDTLQAIRKDMLKQACAETVDDLTPWRLVYVFANAAAVRYGANQGLKHISTGDYIPLHETSFFKKNPTFSDFMAEPVEWRQTIAALILSSYIDNHPIIWKEPTFAMHHFGAKAQENARTYWTPDADFFEMLKKQTILDMIAEVSPELSAMFGNAKVAEVKALALNLFTGQDTDKLKLRLGDKADDVNKAALAWVPKWLRLAPPVPKAKAPAKPKAKKPSKKKAGNDEAPAPAEDAA